MMLLPYVRYILITEDKYVPSNSPNTKILCDVCLAQILNI